MSTWQPFDTAPKDGTWILGFTGSEELYVTMRWWDGFMPDDDDDLSCSEDGSWVGSDHLNSVIANVTHWMAIQPHPEAPPITTSFNAFDALHGTECVSRAERGISESMIAAHQEYYSLVCVYPDDPDDENFDWPDRDKIWASVAAKHGIEVPQ